MHHGSLYTSLTCYTFVKQALAQHILTLNIWGILTQGNYDKFSVQFHLLMLSSCNDDDDDEDYDDDDDDDEDYDEDYDDKEGSDKEGGRPLCVSLLPVNCTASLKRERH